MSGADDDGGAAGGVPVVSLSAFADSAAPSQRDDLASAQNSGRYGYGDTVRQRGNTQSRGGDARWLSRSFVLVQLPETL
jgi:hypothetical protein